MQISNTTPRNHQVSTPSSSSQEWIVCASPRNESRLPQIYPVVFSWLLISGWGKIKTFATGLRYFSLCPWVHLTIHSFIHSFKRMCAGRSSSDFPWRNPLLFQDQLKLKVKWILWSIWWNNTHRIPSEGLLLQTICANKINTFFTKIKN